MRKIVIILFFFSYTIVKAQSLPSDSILLLKIFNHVDIGGRTSTIDINDENLLSLEVSKLTYKINHIENVTIGSKKLLLVICQARIGYMAGQKVGVLNYYYFEFKNNKWNLLYRIVTNEPLPMGETPEFVIVDIGLNKKALAYTFFSTGNHHLERTIYLYELMVDEAKFIGQFLLDYSNDAWVDYENISLTDPCPIESYEGVYEIIKSKKEYFDVKVFIKEKIHSTGCKEEKEVTKVITYGYNSIAIYE